MSRTADALRAHASAATILMGGHYGYESVHDSADLVTHSIGYSVVGPGLNRRAMA